MEKNNAYRSEVPELQVCITDGNSYEEALQMLKKALRNGLKQQRN
jgi:predicted RNase H-like HicB family nuclease